MNKTFPLLLSLAVGLAAVSTTADAGPRDRAAQAKAGAGSFQRHVERKPGSIDISGTTADGRAFERHVDTVKTDNGYTRTMEGTTPNGDAYSRNVVVSRTADGYVRTATRTAPDGTQVTRETVATRNEDGTLSKDVTRTAKPPQNDVAASE